METKFKLELVRQKDQSQTKMLKKIGEDETPVDAAAGGRFVISGLELNWEREREREREFQISYKNPRIWREPVSCAKSAKNVKSWNLGTPMEIIPENQCLHRKRKF